MLKITTLGALMTSAILFSQIGVNTSTPKTIMDVSIKRDTGGAIADNTQPVGLQAPRLTLAELTGNTATYGADQKGAMIYITDVSGGTATGQRINIITIGYYYFDGALWQPLVGATGVSRVVLMAGVPGTQNVQGTSTTPVSGQFTLENIDILNAWTANEFTVPAGMTGLYILSMQSSHIHTAGGTGTWNTIAYLERSTDGGTTWSEIIRDIVANNTTGTVDNGNILYWTGVLNAGDKVRVQYSCNAQTSNIIQKGSFTITKLAQ